MLYPTYISFHFFSGGMNHNDDEEANTPTEEPARHPTDSASEAASSAPASQPAATPTTAAERIYQCTYTVQQCLYNS